MVKKNTKRFPVRAIRTFKPTKFDHAPKQLIFKGDGMNEIGMYEPAYPSIEEQKAWDYDTYCSRLLIALNWYNLTQDVKSLSACALKAFHLTEHGEQLYKKILGSEYELSFTSLKLIRLMHYGFLLRKKEKQFLAKNIRKCVRNPKQKSIVSEDTVKETIQDRLNNKVRYIKAEIDGLFSDFLYDGYHLETNSLGALIQQIPANKRKDVIEHLNSMLYIYKAVSQDRLPYKEDYHHLTAKQTKNCIAWIERAINEVNAVVVKNRVKATKKKKAVAPEKIVAGLKYLRSFEALKLQSANPVEILKASELWTYNTKLRKLQHFVAIPNCTLDVKGSKILNLDESKSIQKTLRKPAEQLKAFTAAQTTVKANKWFGGITGVETKVKNCLSPDTVILRICK